MRSEKWLSDQLELVLSKYFSNIKISNPIEIKWGREAKYRFGSIRLIKPKGIKLLSRRSYPQKSVITITSMFRSEGISEKVVNYTICHELCHYAHGFSSANKKLFRHPHHGGVVNRELTERGAGDLIGEFKKWLKTYRSEILKNSRR
ncbi:hypothetical protein A3A49_03055 [Candidatus Curtissbacteria bacterium RIFCSPLOWO2_01_FULL_38_11b]|uniref:SprT-like domain-containing protein n=1 Tax=Candidatus Curtissbacteria bacterium RIFCSPLOWO2_01_FULL_38_11b TaxID=1797725 RepID=A0A1F5H0S0_9BACT|nr:MAG: hypothetical protein A3A49_03055 [Candidatus Curtissbacteria bacterium RIFCSPLOWO2_01_FULL_38_11b]